MPHALFVGRVWVKLRDDQYWNMTHGSATYLPGIEKVIRVYRTLNRLHQFDGAFAQFVYEVLPFS